MDKHYVFAYLKFKMAGKLNYSVVQRKLVVDLVNSGKSYRQVQEQTGIPFTTISSIMKKFKTYQTVNNIKGKGRKRKTTVREDRCILKCVEKNRFISAPELSKTLHETYAIDISPSTVTRRLHESNFKARRPAKKPYLTNKHMKARLEWAKKYQNQSLAFWKKVIFTDESKYNMVSSDGKQTVWRKPGEKFKLSCMRGTVKYGGGNVMIWGSMAWNGAGNMCFIDDRMNGAMYVDILNKHLKASARKLRLGPKFIFQQDNDPKHTSSTAKQFFTKNKINLLDWPSQSPDLNPIEHLWANIERKLGARRCKKPQELKEKIQQAWNEINPEETKKLVESMPKRIAEVIAARGGPTKY
jgi:transposase